ncbi:MAG: hypothetical protein ACTSQE_11030 [Candidatus Heimdallarchaeaceae archaeon]
MKGVNRKRRGYTLIEAVYIISRSGIPLLFVDFISTEDKIKEVALFSGIISAIQVAMAEIDVGVPSFFDTEKNEIFMSVSTNYAIAIVKDNKSHIERKEIESLISNIMTFLTFEKESMTDFNMLDEEQKEKIRQKISKAVKEWEKDISERDATKRISDSLW